MAEPKTIKINNVEYVQKGTEKAVIYKPRKSGHWQIGKPYFVRTVTMAIHGVLVDVTQQELIFMDAAWIADTKRFSQFANGNPQDGIEVEPFPRNKEVIVGRGSLIDAFQLDGDFKEQK